MDDFRLQSITAILLEAEGGGLEAEEAVVELGDYTLNAEQAAQVRADQVQLAVGGVSAETGYESGLSSHRICSCAWRAAYQI